MVILFDSRNLESILLKVRLGWDTKTRQKNRRQKISLDHCLREKGKNYTSLRVNRALVNIRRFSVPCQRTKWLGLCWHHTHGQLRWKGRPLWPHPRCRHIVRKSYRAFWHNVFDVSLVKISLQQKMRSGSSHTAVLRKNVVWAFRRCWISSDKSWRFGNIWEPFCSNFSENFVGNLIWSARKFRWKVFITFLKNEHFIGGNLAALECS